MGGISPWGRGLLILIAVVLTGACGISRGATETGDQVQTIAFLRAVAGTGETDAAILRTLRGAGFVSGRNLTVLGSDHDEAYPDPESVSMAVHGWLDESVDLIVAFSTSGAMEANKAAPDVNILFLANDPLRSGLVDDEESPDGRMTGVTFRVPADRTLDLARRAIPRLDAIGLAFPEDDPAAEAHRDAVVAAGSELGIETLLATFTGPEEIAGAISELASNGADALLVSTSPTASRALDQLEAASLRAGLPVVANSPLVPWALVSLFPDSIEIGRQMGRQAIRLLNGSPPALIPVENPRRMMLVLNASAASQHGIVFPEDLMREASEVVTGP